MTDKRGDDELPAAVARLGWRYHHVGIPHAEARASEQSVPHLGIHVCGFDTSPFGVEWMRFEPHCPVPDIVRSVPHVAFVVDDLDAALEGRELLIAPNSPSPGVRVAFILDDGAPIELMEFDRPVSQQPYGADLAYIHDAGYGDVARAAAGVLLEELRGAGIERGTVVDVGCGSGILAARAAAAGYGVVGIDVSPAMLDLARRRVPQAEFRLCSFVDADIPSCVGACAVGEILNYGFDPGNDEAARTRFFNRVHDALAPGGVFLFDVAGLDRAGVGGIHRSFSESDDWTVLVEADAREAGTLTRTITTFRRVGTLYRRTAEVHRVMLVDLARVERALAAVGFDVRVLPRYGETALPAGVGAFLCRKPSGGG